MLVAALVLGIILAVIIASRPAEKLLLNPALKVLIALLCPIYGAYVFFIVAGASEGCPYLIGQVFGCLVIIGVCVAIGNALRKRKRKL